MTRILSDSNALSHTASGSVFFFKLHAFSVSNLHNAQFDTIGFRVARYFVLAFGVSLPQL